MKKKWTSSAFWLSVTGALIVVINALANVFHFKVDEVAITSIATSVIGLLVVLGILTKDTKKQEIKKENNNAKLENNKGVDSAVDETEFEEKIKEGISKTENNIKEEIIFNQNAEINSKTNEDETLNQ